jgi:hypothetical protein
VLHVNQEEEEIKVFETKTKESWIGYRYDGGEERSN